MYAAPSVLGARHTGGTYGYVTQTASPEVYADCRRFQNGNYALGLLICLKGSPYLQLGVQSGRFPL